MLTVPAACDRIGLLGRQGDSQSPPLEVPHVPPLPQCFDGVTVVALACVCDRIRSGHPIQDSQAGQRCAGSPPAAPAGNLHPLGLGATPGLLKSVKGIGAVARQPEVGPPKPPCLPGDGRRRFTEQIQGKVRRWTGRWWPTQAAPSYQSTRRQPKHTRQRRIPVFGHDSTVRSGNDAERLCLRGVDLFAQDVQLAGVPSCLLDHVHVDPSQRHLSHPVVRPR